MMYTSSMKKYGFTLAEVLITLAIIGVVAAMTIPTLVQNYNEKVYKERKSVADIKMTEVTRQMNFYDDLAPHQNTESFINSLRKYLKIPKVCYSDNLKNCFAASITKSTGEVIDVSSLTNSTSLGKNYSDNNYAFSILDGLTYILTWDSSCKAPDKYNSKESTTNCLGYILDINGSAGPNTVGKDIVLVNVSLPGGGCNGIEVDGLCIASADTEYSCTAQSDGGYSMDGSASDCYAQANNACQAIGMRAPNSAESTKIYLNREALGYPANVIEGMLTNENVEVPDNYDDYLASDEYQNQMNNASEDEMAYSAYFAYSYSIMAGYNKIRCVQ